MRFQKIYVEITNVCNLSCSFCPGTVRQSRRMTKSEFKTVLDKISGYTEYIYFHLLGEPLIHPDLEEFLKIASEKKFKVTITTNGTLINKCRDILLNSDLYKIVFSLHSFEANNTEKSLDEYLDPCFDFVKSANGKFISVFRLWNKGGLDENNSLIEKKISEVFPCDMVEGRGGIKLCEKTFLQYGDKFDWPSEKTDDTAEKVFCYGLRDQIGILCDGTVVPCCLDNDGTIALGNIFESELEQIIICDRAQNIYNGFSKRCAVEKLCQGCKYARRF